MRDAAVNLALDDHRIDAAAGVLHRDIAQDRDPAGFDIDLNLDDMTGIGISKLIDAESRARFKPRLDVLAESRSPARP